MARHHVRVVVVWRRQILAVQHHDTSDGHRFWLPPGGGVEEGEAAEEAGVREVREETGLDVRVVRREAVPAAPLGPMQSEWWPELVPIIRAELERQAGA